MAPPRRRRFYIPNDDIEAKAAREEKAAAECAHIALDVPPEVALETKARRESLMQEWNDFFVHPDDVWLGLCLDNDNAKTKAVSFLKEYVANSVQDFLILVPFEQTGMKGTKETESRRTVTSAHSLLQVWRTLIAQADATVLLRKRREDPENKHKWRLAFVDHRQENCHGAVAEISRWIFGKGAAELFLTTELLKRKREAVAKDIMAVAQIMWENPEFLACAPEVRIAFIIKVVLIGIGGFRLKALRDIKFNQVVLSVVNKPGSQSETTIAVTFRIPIVKERNVSKGKRAKWISFTVYFVPNAPSICLASLTAALAIEADAFDPGIDSVEALLQRPILEKTDVLPLKWKEEMKDEVIFKIDDATFRKLWKKAWLALGAEELDPPYAARVGVGMDLDGVLADPLRNYIMSNTSAVFEKSYQSETIRVNLLRHRFSFVYSEEAARQSEELEATMRAMVSYCDPNAPIEPSKKYLDSFNLRRDVSGLAKCIEKAKADREPRTSRKQLQQQHQRLIDRLSALAVQEMRGEYFNRVHRLRALGQSTLDAAAADGHIEVRTRNAKTRRNHGGLSLEQVSHYIRLHKEMATTGSTKPKVIHNTGYYLELLLGYLQNRLVVSAESRDDNEDAEKFEVLQQDGTMHLCLLCRENFCTIDSLTKHCKKMHVEVGTFDHSFPCPECYRSGIQENQIINGVSSWCKHVEIFHGQGNAPNLRTEAHSAAVETKTCCPFCGLFTSSVGAGRHRISHVQDGATSEIFSRPFPCMVCRNELSKEGEKRDILIHDCSSWNAHVSMAHPEEQTWLVKEQVDQPSMVNERPVCLLCDDRRSFPSQDLLTKHCNTVHVKNGRKFDSPFSCPECRKSGMSDYLVDSTLTWRRHVAASHGIHNMPSVLQAAPGRSIAQRAAPSSDNVADNIRQKELPAVCFLCLERPSFSFKSNLTAHCKSKHVNTGRFDKPFPCPECQRSGMPEYLITSPSCWSSHVQTAHGQENAPTLRSEPVSPRTMICPFCGKSSSGKHRQDHVREGAASSIFSKPFPCLACRANDFIIDGCSEWNSHVLTAHSERARTWTVEMEGNQVKKRGVHEIGKTDGIQCLLCDGVFPPKGVWIHVMRAHLPSISSGCVSCLDCKVRNPAKHKLPSHITGVTSWNEHLQSAHSDLLFCFLATRSNFSVDKNMSTRAKRSRIDTTVLPLPGPGESEQCSTYTTGHVVDDMVSMPSNGIDINLIDPILLLDWQRSRV